MSYAEEYLQKHSLPGVKEFLEHLGDRMPSCITTIGSDIAANAAADFYGFNDSIGNPIVIDNGNRIIRVDANIRDGKDKLEATQEMLGQRDLSIKDGIVLGNDLYDHDLMRASRVAMASPLADEATQDLVRSLNGVVIADYSAFLRELQSV
jgi:phosphoserine phosphatase